MDLNETGCEKNVVLNNLNPPLLDVML
jgi:hypothetical protein